MHLERELTVWVLSLEHHTVLMVEGCWHRIESEGKAIQSIKSLFSIIF